MSGWDMQDREGVRQEKDGNMEGQGRRANDKDNNFFYTCEKHHVGSQFVVLFCFVPDDTRYQKLSPIINSYCKTDYIKKKTCRFAPKLCHYTNTTNKDKCFYNITIGQSRNFKKSNIPNSCYAYMYICSYVYVL